MLSILREKEKRGGGHRERERKRTNYFHRSYHTASLPFRGLQHKGPAITCQRFVMRASCLAIVNSKFSIQKTHKRCRHERLQSYSQTPVKSPSPFRPSVLKAKWLQTSMPTTLKYLEGTNHRHCMF